MRPSSLSALFVAAALVASGCSGDDDERGAEGLSTPTFAPADEADGDDTGDDAGGSTTTTTADEGSTTTEAAAGSGSSTTTAAGEEPVTTTSSTTSPPQERVSVDDPDDDAVGGLDDDPPAWTDLAGVTLVRQGNAYALRVQLAGGDAPETSDGESTMNIASFYDVDGDGDIDYEVWANLGPEGWGGSWFDDQGNGAFGEDSNVSIEVDGDEVVILFPDVMLDVPDQFRFSVASEYGGMDVLGSSFARRDDVPDDDQSVWFPS